MSHFEHHTAGGDTGRKCGNQGRVLFGVIVIGFGVLALLDNLHLFSARDYIQFWPAVLIIVGALKLNQARHTAGYLIGGGLVMAGILITLSNLGIIYFRMRDWWPMFIIIGGLAMVSKGLYQRNPAQLNELDLPSSNPELRADVQQQIDTIAFMSANKMKVLSQDFRGGEVTAVMGGIEIDFRQAALQTDATLQVFAMWGGIALKIPADWTVVSNGIPILGGFDDKTVPPMVPGKRLIIEGYVVMGGIEIRN